MRKRIALAALLTGILISVMWTRRTGARWYPAHMRAVHEMLRLARVEPQDVIYDLGSGDGRILITAARRHGARAVGIEIDPVRFLLSRMAITVFGLSTQVQVRRENFFIAPLEEASVITCFLLQETNERLEATLRSRLNPGTRVVSLVHTFPGLPLLRENVRMRIYVYEIPERT